MAKCILCFTEHERAWKDGANMYCESCEAVREAAKGTISEIVPYLFLGDMIAATNFKHGDRMCVHEMKPTYDGDGNHYHHIPILSKRPNSPTDRSGAIVSVEQLRKAVYIIEFYQTMHMPLLVHCHGGVERSPLTVAAFLVKSGECKDFTEAYTLIKSVRPVVSERLFWLPEGFSPGVVDSTPVL